MHKNQGIVLNQDVLEKGMSLEQHVILWSI